MPTTAATSDQVAREMRYVLTDINSNCNKFWHARLLTNDVYETHWGRVGEFGQIKRISAPVGAGPATFEAKCREKERKGYRLQRTLEGTLPFMAERETAARLAQVASEQIVTDAPETIELIRHLATVNVHQILSATALTYDASNGRFSTPLGIVTSDGIAEARRLLTEIASFVAVADWANTGLIGNVNEYLMLIPQNVGRSRPDPRLLFPTIEAVQLQNGILDALESSVRSALKDADAKRKEADGAQEKITGPTLFEADLRLVRDADAVERIRRKYRSTLQTIHASHCLDVTRVFDLRVASMERAFEHGRTIGNVQELWHGTRAGNLLSILRSGFVIPPSSAPHVTGRMFGNGVYFSDQSTKSLNYACGIAPRQSGATAAGNNRVYMLLCDVAMGNAHTPDRPGRQIGAPEFDSTFAQAGVSGVLNNEMIVYRTSQINPAHLVEFGAAAE